MEEKPKLNKEFPKELTPESQTSSSAVSRDEGIPEEACPLLFHYNEGEYGLVTKTPFFTKERGFLLQLI